jgi:hypothetical protein
MTGLNTKRLGAMRDGEVLARSEIPNRAAEPLQSFHRAAYRDDDRASRIAHRGFAGLVLVWLRQRVALDHGGFHAQARPASGFAPGATAGYFGKISIEWRGGGKLAPRSPSGCATVHFGGSVEGEW